MKTMRRRLICILLVLGLCFPAGTGIASSAREFGQVTAEGVRLRSEPNTDSEVLAELPLNTELEVITADSGWYRVLYGNIVGYVRQDYIFVNSTITKIIKISQFC